MSSRRLFILGALTTLLVAGVVVALPAAAQGVDLQEFAAQAGFAQADIRLVIARLIRTLITFLGIIVVGLILYGGFVWMTAGGDVERVSTAKRILTNAVIGLVIVVSSFAITQFVLSSLTRAIGGTIGAGGPDGGGGFYQDRTDAARRFTLVGWNDACGGRLRNLQLQLVFSQAVSTSSVTSQTNPGIVVKDRDGAAVDGTFAVSGKTVTFTPAAICPGTTTERCFSNDSTYTVEFMPTVLRSTTGRQLDCGGGFGSCTFSFTTGSVIDSVKPTMTMSRPDTQGGNGVVGDIVSLQARAQDDGGVSLTQFFAGSATAVYVAGLEDSTAKTLAADNYFATDATEWNTIASTPGSIKLWASGADCAGHTAVSPQVTFSLQALSCSNGVQDGDETGVDEGGSCGAGEGGACRTTTECAAGLSCKDGTCQNLPRIDRVSSGDGAIGNLVTISGIGFGTTPGKIVFLGDPAKPEDDSTVEAYNACPGTWSNKQIIVQVPGTAQDGALEVRTAGNAASDKTNDSFGSRLNDFDVNETVRPGICSIQPASGTGSIQVAIAGNNFGAARGNGSVYFGDYAAAAYAGVWTPSSLNTTVPLLNPSAYPTQVFVGDNVCAGTTPPKLCRSDAECPAGGTCLLGRQGSNTVTYTALALSERTPPTISSVESGWRVCSAGSANEGKKCSADADCGGGGVCANASDWGPPGQYLTIFGNNFGTLGSVRFESKSSGDEALGDTLFPEQCSVAFWSNTSVIVKVPKIFLNSQQISPGAYDLVIDRSGVKSAPATFNIIDDVPGPGICRLEPSAGPVGTVVKILGEQFVGTIAGIIFNENQTASHTAIDTNTLEAVVPAGAKTGPVSVERGAPSPARSNAVPFTVGNCQTTPNLCAAGTSCCANGTCAVSCEVARESHYAYLFSTGAIPLAPYVLVACNAGVVASPTPWEGWSEPKAVCVNAAIGATFNINIDKSTLTGNVVVQECTGRRENPCNDLGAVMTGSLSSTNKSFSWGPPSADGHDHVLFKPDTTYQVKLQAAGIRSESSIVDEVETGRIPMERDFVWRFRTAPNDTPCRLGSVIVNPDQALADEAGHKEPYTAEPMSADDRCVQILCEASMRVAWSTEPSDPTIAEFIGPETPLHCGERVQANNQPPAPGNDVKIRATITSGDGQPSSSVSDTGTLTIDFTDPNVSESWPTCQTACINTSIGAKFNTTMRAADLTAAGAVKLYQCENAVCEASRLTEVSGVTVAYPENEDVPKLLIKPAAGTNLLPDTYYRVTISGDVASESGIPLSVANQSHGYSWIFRTRNSTEACAIDRIEIEPTQAVMSRVGERQEYSAVPYGAPDDCALNGQPLDVDDYMWSDWRATDMPDRVPEPVRVADMLNSGAIQRFPSNRLPPWCTTGCLNAGATVPVTAAICGNGVWEKEKGEDCDDGNTQKGDGCSGRCLIEPSLRCGQFCVGSNLACTADENCSAGTACETRTTGCCGDGVKAAKEECDPGATTSEACTEECVFRGSTTFCGNGLVENKLGEECDDSNTRNGDGCSSRCLHEGSVSKADVVAICGNGIWEKEKGEDCDDGNAVSGDGCSSRCLNEGTNACVYECVGGSSAGSNCASPGAICAGGGICSAANAPCCGNGTTERGEDFDDGNAVNGDGLSSRCLKEGSSAFYAIPSFCGDQVKSTGEECEVSATSTAATQGPYGVSQIASSAPQEVDPSTGLAKAKVSVNVGVKEGAGQIALQCSCTNDASCGSASSVGCGVANCCYDRPQISSALPAADADNRCRNTAVSVSFTKTMDPASLNPSTGDNYQPNLYLELVSIGGQPITEAECGTRGHRWTQVALGSSPERGGWLSRAWEWITETVGNLFSQPVRAAHDDPGISGPSAQGRCLLPVTYSVAPNGASGGSKVFLNLSKLLEPSSTYRIVVLGDWNVSDGEKFGVRSREQVTMNLAKWTQGFSVGTDICTLASVNVLDQGKGARLENGTFDVVDDPEDPSPQMFTRTGEAHGFTATAYSNEGEEINRIPNVYDWTWSWGDNLAACTGTNPPTPSGCDKNVVNTEQVPPGADGKTKPEANVTAAGNNGDETVFAAAEIVTPAPPAGQSPARVTGSLPVTAFLCENPSTIGEYVDTDENVVDPSKRKPTNLGFFYCQDFGKPGFDDDLPDLLGAVPVPSPQPNLYKEILFPLVGTGDGLGVRVEQNADYLPPDIWYALKGFKGSPTLTTFDGYEAVQDGTTLYVFAPNRVNPLYPNIYTISYNPNAEPRSQEAFKRILSTWTFNKNVSDMNLCRVGSTYIQKEGAFLSCTSDAECRAASSDAGVFCDAEKAKLRRDTKRLSDMVRIKRLLDNYGASHKFCSVTRNQSCITAAQCPGGESCVPSYPPLASGSFIRAMSTSKWPSWAAALGNAIGSALPKDPLNTIADCRVKNEDGTPTGYDAETCFNALETKFICPLDSHLYGFRASANEGYTFYSQLEYNGTHWSEPIDKNTGDALKLVAEYYTTPRTGSFPTGGFDSASFCTGVEYGTSAACGDGVKGDGEDCEVGDVSVADCTTTDGKPGRKNVGCRKDTCEFETAADSASACVPLACGNSVVDLNEECDLGSRNGTYGAQCTTACCRPGSTSARCQGAQSFYCGDGQIAGGEQCDLGSQNGQYTAAPDSSCSFDCKSPGPSCGDGEVQEGQEACDGNTESTSAAVAVDNLPACPSANVCIGGTRAGMICSTTKRCQGGPNSGNVCTAASNCSGWTGGAPGVGLQWIGYCLPEADCPDGTCSTITYQTSRTRTCSNACSWPNWTECTAGPQSCGNGVKEGTEECDDGNTKDTDACTGQCKKNICGDGFTYAGVESCDRGSDNGKACTAAYGGTCNFCTIGCVYKTSTGDFCGDGKLSGPEFCDAGNIPSSCFKSANGVLEREGTCNPTDEGQTGVAADATSGYKGCPEGFTCRKLGVCNGGLKNGQMCTSVTTGSNITACDSPDKCVFPTCAGDCRTACPFSFSSASLKLKRGDIIGGEPQSSIELYSITSGKKPDVAALLIPACKVMQGVFADVEKKNFRPPTLDLVFVTDLSGSMGWTVDGGTETRLAVVQDSTKKAINDFFATYRQYNQTLRIALVSFDGCRQGKVDHDFTTDKDVLIDIVNTYTAQCGTPTDKGLTAGLNLIKNSTTPSTAEVKALILLSDGEPNNKTTAMDVVKQWSGNDAGKPTTLAEGVKLYSAAVTTDASLISFMRHVSSDFCLADHFIHPPTKTYASEEGCTANKDDNAKYAYAGSTADEVKVMYEKITENLLGIVLSFVSNLDGSSVTSPGSITEGKAQPLPVPAGFTCTGTSSILPFTISIDSDEATVSLDNFKFTYCPE